MHKHTTARGSGRHAPINTWGIWRLMEMLQNQRLDDRVLYVWISSLSAHFKRLLTSQAIPFINDACETNHSLGRIESCLEELRPTRDFLHTACSYLTSFNNLSPLCTVCMVALPGVHQTMAQLVVNLSLCSSRDVSGGKRVCNPQCHSKIQKWLPDILVYHGIKHCNKLLQHKLWLRESGSMMAWGEFNMSFKYRQLEVIMPYTMYVLCAIGAIFIGFSYNEACWSLLAKHRS